MRELTYNEAAVEAVAEEMRRDPKIFYMSTDALPPLLKEFGDERIRATPITEAALTGMAIGAAGCGFALSPSASFSPLASVTTAGSRMENVEPTPGLVSTAMSPPMASQK